MPSKKIYLLHLLMLGGCSNIVRHYSMSKNSCCCASATNLKAKECNERTKEAISSISKEELREHLLKCAEEINKESKDNPKNAVEMFRKKMASTLLQYFNAKLNYDFIYRMLGDMGMKAFCKKMNNKLPNYVNSNIEDNLINSLLSHVKTHKDICARVCAEAVADIAINSIRLILQPFLSRCSLTSPE